jgi:hypothetical protein
VRESRSVGLPEGLPDIHGLAVRVTNPDGTPGDLLLATTGWGRLTRFVLTVSRTTYGRPMTTLLPYRTDAGPVLLGARSDPACGSRRTGPHAAPGVPGRGKGPGPDSSPR